MISINDLQILFLPCLRSRLFGFTVIKGTDGVKFYLTGTIGIFFLEGSSVVGFRIGLIGMKTSLSIQISNAMVLITRMP